MDCSLCIFCDSEYGDPLLPYHVEKVAGLCHLTSGKEKLLNSKICMRCKLDVDLIENAMRLREVMVTSLNGKLAAAATAAANAAAVSNHYMVAVTNGHTVADRLQQQVLPDHLLPGNTRPVVKEDLVPAHSVASLPSLPQGPLPPSSLPQASLPQANYSVGLGFPLMTNGVTPSPVRTNGRRIQNCHKCNISLKTRPYPDAMKHINRCNGQGIRPGRPSLTPKPDVFPCHRCGRKLATREAHEIHMTKCDGTNSNTRGRKPADNTCMLCSEDLVYRHILKKHLRQKHGINAQRLDDSVLAALKTGSGTGNDVKEQVISRIQQKMLSDLYEYEQQNGDAENQDSALDDTQDNNGDSVAEDDGEDHGTIPATLLSANHPQGSRSRRKVKPSKYVPEIFTCDACCKQFEQQSEYVQHSCFTEADKQQAGDMEGGELAEDAPTPPQEPDTVMEVEVCDVPDEEPLSVL